MAAILDNSKSSLSEHAFSPLSTPVGDPPVSCGTTEIRSRASSSSGSIGRVKSNRCKRNTSSSNQSANNGDANAAGSSQKLHSPLQAEDYERYVNRAIESYGADEASSLDESFEDASSNRLSSYIQGYPSVDEEESRLGAVSGRGMSGGGGGKSGVSWRRQRSTRISALLTSGNSTDRSSTYSWGEDEFDKHATKCVASMFEEIDQVLFEDRKSRNAVLNKECKEWTSEFTYIRVLGSSVCNSENSDFLSSIGVSTPVPTTRHQSKASRNSLPTNGDGTSSLSQLNESETSSSGFHSDTVNNGSASTQGYRTSSDVTNESPSVSTSGGGKTGALVKRNSSQQIARRSSDLNATDSSSSITNDYCVMGMGMGINRVPSPTVPSFDHYQAHTPLGPLDMYVEETFEEEGEIEEVFAYDNQELSTEAPDGGEMANTETKFHVPRKKRRGFPPVTPFACTRDTTFDNVLQACWPEIIRISLNYISKRVANISDKLSDDIQDNLVTPDSQLSPHSKEQLVSMQQAGRLGSIVGGGANMTSSQIRLGTANSQATAVELSDVLSIAPKRIVYRREDPATNSTTNFYFNPNSKNQHLSLVANGTAISNNVVTKNRYPSAKTRLQPISMARNKQRGSVISGPFSGLSNYLIHSNATQAASGPSMVHNPMVVRKLFPETQMAADRIMTPPITLGGGGGGYRYNQLPPIDPTQESDFQNPPLPAASQNNKTVKAISSGNSSKNNPNSRVFSARTDEIGVKRAVKTFALQKENYFIDYSRPSTTAEIRDEVPSSPLGNSKWHPYSLYHTQTPPQISPLVTTTTTTAAHLLRSRNSQDFLSQGLVGNGIVGVSMNLNYREDSTLSDETVGGGGNYGGTNMYGGQHNHHHHPSSQGQQHQYPQQQQQQLMHGNNNYSNNNYHMHYALNHQHHGGDPSYGNPDQQQPNSRPSSRHPRNTKLGTAR
ncbi:serine-rich adhesin for platelets-like isoform X2 [Symsagittifera roscoffensis]|uniref:serine-rich adhesin for platelets-like isoform X2 n=1 Tax=Symsagittifera roscoffensis TaxID=84072 RepID=UPI00307C8082